MNSLIRSNLLPLSIFDSFKDIDDIFGGYKTNIPYNVAHLLDKDGKVVATRVEVALAGYSKEDIQVKIVNNDLQIMVDKADSVDELVNYIHKGIAGRSAQLKFKLVNGYDVKNIKSVFKDGLLAVEVPVDTGNTIDIKVD